MMSFTSGPWNEFNSMPSGKGKNSWEGASLWNGGGNSEIFYVHLYLVKWSNLTDMFQRGWFNHQRVHGMPRKFLCQIPTRPIQHPSKGAGFFLDPEFTHQHKTPRLQRQIGCNICIYFVYMFFYLHIYICVNLDIPWWQKSLVSANTIHDQRSRVWWPKRAGLGVLRQKGVWCVRPVFSGSGAKAPGLAFGSAMQQDRVPSSHGSLGGEEGEGDAADHGRHAADPLDAGSDGFDSEEFREFLRQRNERRSGTRGGGARRGLQNPRRRDLDDSDDDRSGGTAGKGAGGQPPEWDGNTSFQDWLIKAKLWLATTRARPKTQGPLILQRLSGPPFQAFKHWARDADWLQDDRGGFKLLDAMNGPDQFGEDKEEDLLASLAKITYHLRRGKDEGLRTFFARWDESLRKVREHSVVLPDKYLGFLLINALNLSDQEIKGMLTFTRGSIIPAEVKSWARKHEMKLNAKDIGIEKDRKSTSGSTKVGSGNVHYMAEDDDADEEILMMEDALQELRDEDWQEEEAPEADGSILDEHEVAEILNTMVQKKRTFMQSLKTKKAKELSRGFGNWKGGGKGYAASGPGASSSRSSSSLHATGRLNVRLLQDVVGRNEGKQSMLEVPTDRTLAQRRHLPEEPTRWQGSALHREEWWEGDQLGGAGRGNLLWMDGRRWLSLTVMWWAPTRLMRTWHFAGMMSRMPESVLRFLTTELSWHLFSL